MNSSICQLPIYHITDVANLSGILAAGGLKSDVAMAKAGHTVIGFGHIKKRRMEQIKVNCCADRFVGEFVPFYFCPRSPMLFSVNMGDTGRPRGCQTTILHFVSSVGFGLNCGRPWAVSDGNAGAMHTSFRADEDGIKALDWTAIRATDWKGKQHQKAAEFLVADSFEWTGFSRIGCHNKGVAAQVSEILKGQVHQPVVDVQPAWYY